MKIEVFHSLDPAKLQTQVNSFLELSNIKVQDVQFQTCLMEGSGVHFSAMVSYEGDARVVFPGDDEDE